MTRYKYLLVLGIIILFRLALQAFLYHAGFESMTADEFGRAVLAARWAEKPYALWNGPWLPFFMYMHGIALKLVWELLWVPRTITILFGIASIILVYKVSLGLFENEGIALTSAILLAVNPFHVWLSSTALSEIPYTALLFAFFFGFIQYLKIHKIGYLYLAGFSLAFANGIRFEGWIVSIMFTIFLIGQVILSVRSHKKITGLVGHLVIVAIIPWLLPAAWTVASYLQTKDLIASLTLIKSYKSNWYGENRYYLGYLKTFFEADPFLTISVPIIIGVTWYLNKKSRPIQWYLLFATIPILAFILIHQGQLEPLGNIKRYLAPFIFFLYPAFAYLLTEIVELITPVPRIRAILLGFIVLIMVFSQSYKSLHYIKDPVSDGLKVGERIRQIRKENPGIAHKPVLIELSYWQYLAVHVGANDIHQILYDRPLDYEARESRSLITSNPEAFRSCLVDWDISYVIVKSRKLKDALEKDLRIYPTEKINKYSFFPIPPELKQELSGNLACPIR